MDVERPPHTDTRPRAGTPQASAPRSGAAVRASIVIRFAGDSGDGMQLTGDRFTHESAVFGNDLATRPEFPAEIRAPQGSPAGVSSFQIQIADHDILTAGDEPDVLVAMNPAALAAHAGDLRPGATIVIDSDEFTGRNLTRAGYGTDPLSDGSLAAYTVHTVPMTSLARAATEPTGVGRKAGARAKNMFALGLVSWMYGRSLERTIDFLRRRFAHLPDLAEADVRALRAGRDYGETTESFVSTVHIGPAALPPGTYRQITGNTALAYGLLTAGALSGLPVFLGSYPITPASDILHELSRRQDLGVTTFQAEDEIAAIGAALGAALGGALGVCSTSGPGLALKSETIGLAVMTELPLIVIDVQRGGPSTGLPTRTEQSDLLQAMFGRNGESPVPVLAPCSPGDCFDIAVAAARIALTYRTPVLVLSDASLANGSQPWAIPEVAAMDRIDPGFEPDRAATDDPFQPYARDPATLARPLAVPGTRGRAHRIGGLEKADGSGDISYDPANHERMVRLRRAKIDGIPVPGPVVDDPDGRAEVLVVGWGGTHGAIGAGCRAVRARGIAVAHLHLRHLHPLPPDLGDILRRYRTVVAPELNGGQLALLLRGRYLVDIHPWTKVTGTTFTAHDIEAAIDAALEGTLPDREAERTAAALAAATYRTTRGAP